ncbi:MAG: hypothetical protein EZS28_032285, partial [Streblomastix strix]
LSRLAWRGDYMIKPEILQQTMEQLQFFPQLDTFATRTMRQCNRYCSIQNYRRAEGKRGAFSINWTNEDLLLHPPIELIPRVLKKMKLEPSMALFLLPIRAEEGQVTGKTSTQITSRRPISCTNDKYSIGEQLFRDLAAAAGLAPTTIQQMIDNSNWETWRKRRAGLTIMVRYLKLNEIDSMALLGERPDIHVVNAMAWLNDLGGQTRKSNLIALKAHTSVVLGQFSKMPNISDSPLIKQFTRCLNLNIDSKARYNVIWDIQKLFDHISNSTFSSPEEIQMKAMALLVSFSAARMTELSRMTMKDLDCSQKNRLIISTIIKKGNKIRNETITLNRLKNQLYPVKALQSWIQSREKINIQEESLFWDFKKHTIPSSLYCSQTLTTIIRQFGIQSPYNGPSIRHATMTKLRASGASVLEVNAFSRHILTSTVVDAFYYRPVQRDFGSLLIKSVRMSAFSDLTHISRFCIPINNGGLIKAGLFSNPIFFLCSGKDYYYGIGHYPGTL